MDVETIRVFIEVMRRGSFSLVARDRNLDPSSVSRSVATLESYLGVRLFQRTTRRLSPTDAAREYFERVDPLLGDLERAAVVAADSERTPRGLLRVAVAPTFAQETVVPLLPGFAKSYPELSFELLLTDKPVDLVAEQIDVAVRLGRRVESSLTASRICSFSHVVCASPQYLESKGRPKTPGDLERHDCLRYPVVGYGPRWRFQRGSEDPFDVEIRGRLTVSSGVLLRQCAIDGMGVAILPRWCISNALAEGALVPLLREFRATPSDFDLGVWVAHPSRTYVPVKVRVFHDYLKAKVG